MKNLLPVLFFLLFSSFSFGQWTFKTPAPTTKWGHVTVELNGFIYVFAGSSGATFRYDPANGSWTTLAPIPTSRYYAAAAAANGKIYVMGGSAASGWSSAVEEYDPVTNTWATKTPMTSARTTLGAAAVGNKIYLIGGWNGSNMSLVEAYDVVGDVWSAAAPMPTARGHAKCAVVGTNIYVVGGYAGSWLTTNEVYNSTTNSWTTATSMSTGRYIHGIAPLNGKVWAIAGFSGSSTGTTEFYDPLTNTWTAGPSVNTPRHRTDAAATSTCIYLIGGYNGSNLATVEEYCEVNILPVELSFFSGEKNETTGHNDLRWITQTERDNDYFRLERSEDVTTWSEIKSVPGVGNSTSPSNYSFTDKFPKEDNYYRLIQVDFDGSETVYSIIYIKNKIGECTIFPNPTNGVFNVSAETNGSLRVINSLGKEVLRFSGDLNNEQFDLQENPGAYMLEVTTKGQVCRSKLLVISN